MPEDIIFEITEKHLESGMRGVPIGYCHTSYIDPQKGLFYAGRPLFEVSVWDPARVIFLLKNGFDGSSFELKEFQDLLKKHAPLHKEAMEYIRKLPKNVDPITLFSMAVSIVASFEQTGNDEIDAIHLMAKIPSICALVINHHAGWETMKSYDIELGYIENFVNMINPPECDKQQFMPLMKLYSILHFDHGGGSLEAFVGKIVSSASSGMYTSVASAIQSLAGKLNGKAAKICLEWLKQIGQKPIDAKKLEEHLLEKIKNAELIYGFGHPTFRIEDSRATILYNYARKHFAQHPLVHLALLLRYSGAKILSKHSKISNPNPNVDAIAGVAISASGFDYPKYFSLLLAMSRSIGVIIQILNQKSGSKKMPLFHPHYFYRCKPF